MMTGFMMDISGCSPLMSHSCPPVLYRTVYACIIWFHFFLHLFTTGYASRTYNAFLSSRWLRSMALSFCVQLLLERHALGI